MSRLSLPQELRGQRCILHIDLDCFYCQVEQLRLGLSSESPVAVQQWNGLIAVNYAAKKAGIKRHCPIEEAKKKCPDLILVHVATYANHESEPRYHPSPHSTTHKVSLEPYRRASAKIFGVFARFCVSLGAKLQKAGTDEAFMDVTDGVNQRMVKQYGHLFAGEGEENGGQSCPVEVDWEKLGIVIDAEEATKETVNVPGEAEPSGEGGDQAANCASQESKKTLSKVDWGDVQLSVGAELAHEIRKAILDELGYTCSAGVAHNKTLAKVCSGLNKPNNQTILCTRAVLEFMRNLPFKKIRNLGGKLGNEVEAQLDICTASDMWKYSMEELQFKFGQATGIWLYNICRGIDFADVTPSDITKSMMAAKSFRPPVRDLSAVEHWVNILAAEVFTRLQFDYEMHSRWPKTFAIHFRIMSEPTARSKSCPMPKQPELKSPGILAQKALALFRAADYRFPLINFSITAGMFEKDGTAESSDISRFLVRGEGTTARNCASGESAVVKAADEAVPIKKRATSELQGEDRVGNVVGGSSKGGTVDHREREKSPCRSSGQGFGDGGIEAFLVRGKRERDGPAQRDGGEQGKVSARRLEHKDIRRFFEGRDRAPTKVAEMSLREHAQSGSEPISSSSWSSSSSSSFITTTSAAMTSSTFSSQADGHNRCSKCGLQVPDAELVEHQDFHFAVELQDEERRGVSLPNVATTAPPGGAEQKRNASSAKERDQVETKRRKRELFFQPRSTG